MREFFSDRLNVLLVSMVTLAMLLMVGAMIHDARLSKECRLKGGERVHTKSGTICARVEIIP